MASIVSSCVRGWLVLTGLCIEFLIFKKLAYLAVLSCLVSLANKCNKWLVDGLRMAQVGF